MELGQGWELQLSEQALEVIVAAPKVVVAYSGGCDSQVLLDLLRRWKSPGEWLLAVHIDHGLARDSSKWVEHCRNYCRQWQIDLIVKKIDARAPRSVSPEGHARTLRYRALASCLPPQGLLLTAHHADDQAETMLLQALRGAGVDGMSGMPFRRPFAAGILLRPMLEMSREQVRGYAVGMGLDWVEDQGNQDQSFDRNYIRHSILPLLTKRWPAAARTLALNCSRFAVARRLLEVQAMEDLGDGVSIASIDMAKLGVLAVERAANVFRYWLRQHGVVLPPERRLHEMLRQFLTAAEDRQPKFICAEDIFLYRYRQRVYLVAATPPPPPPLLWQLKTSLSLPLPWGSLRAVPAALATGLDSELQCEVRFRRGGELLYDGRVLKKFFQQRGVLPWWRDKIPLIFAEGRVICVPGLWCSLAHRPAPGGSAVEVRWDEAPTVLAYKDDLSL